MIAKNDITGDLIKTKTTDQNAYAEGWERIFGKKQQTENPESMKDTPYDEGTYTGQH